MEVPSGLRPAHNRAQSESPLTRPKAPILGIRDDGVERLIKGSPAENATDLNALRAWTRETTREISRWQIERARNRNRLGQGGRP